MNLIQCEAWRLEWVICKNFGFLYCFRQGRMLVTLRNKNNIGLIWFMFISSSDFWLLCRLMAKKEKLSQNAQNNLKLCQKWCRHTEDPWLEYIESIFVDFKNVSDRFCLYNEHLTPFFATGGTFNSIILLWPNYLVFFITVRWSRN